MSQEGVVPHKEKKQLGDDWVYAPHRISVFFFISDSHCNRFLLQNFDKLEWIKQRL